MRDVSDAVVDLREQLANRVTTHKTEFEVLATAMLQARAEGAAEALEWAAAMADEYAQRQQNGEISGVFGEMRIIRDAIRYEIERRKKEPDHA